MVRHDNSFIAEVFLYFQECLQDAKQPPDIVKVSIALKQKPRE